MKIIASSYFKQKLINSFILDIYCLIMHQPIPISNHNVLQEYDEE